LKAEEWGGSYEQYQRPEQCLLGLTFMEQSTRFYNSESLVCKHWR